MKTQAQRRSRMLFSMEQSGKPLPKFNDETTGFILVQKIGAKIATSLGANKTSKALASISTKDERLSNQGM